MEQGKKKKTNGKRKKKCVNKWQKKRGKWKRIEKRKINKLM